jgi:diguanylate cyclase (GGDEF)-like protein
LGNRLRLREDLEALEAAMARYGRTECMVVLDVDWFKGYNDTHGHQAGDAALKAIARVIEASLRRDDRAYRYGGEEFLLLLPEQPAESGRVVAERVRGAVEALGLAGERPLTLSAGVAAGGRELGPDRLLSLADEALYRAKGLGRNRVELAGRPG